MSWPLLPTTSVIHLQQESYGYLLFPSILHTSKNVPACTKASKQTRPKCQYLLRQQSLPLAPKWPGPVSTVADVKDIVYVPLLTWSLSFTTTTAPTGEHEANSHLLCLKSPLASAVYGGHNSPTFGWSPTTAAFFHKRNMQSPYYSGFDGTGISSALRREFSPSDSATIPLTARPNRNKGMSPGSTHDGSLPLTPSMYLASNGGGGGSGGSGNDHPHGLGGLNLNHVVTASEAAYNDGNDSSSRHLMPPSLYGHTHLHPHRHWDNSKTPTASTHRYAPTQNQIQPDLASASESSNTNEDDSKSTRDNSHTPTVSRPGDGNSASSSSGGVNLPPLAGVAAGLRTYSPKDLYSLSTPSRFSLSNTMDEHANGSSAGVGPGGLPPLRSGGLSWFLNDWPNSNGNPPTHNGIHAFRSIVGGPDGGFGSGGNVHPSALVNSNASNGVVFTPGGTLRESQSVIAPTSSTAAGALLSGGASRPVVMGKPPLAARAPRGRPSTASSRTSGPLSAFRSSAMSDDYAMSEANDEDDDRRHGREDPVHDGYRPYHSAPGGLSVPLPSPEELLSIKGGGGGGFNARTGDSYRASDSRQLRYETDEARWQAVQQRDARASAAFFYCVLTTKVSEKKERSVVPVHLADAVVATLPRSSVAQRAHHAIQSARTSSLSRRPPRPSSKATAPVAAANPTCKAVTPTRNDKRRSLPKSKSVCTPASPPVAKERRSRAKDSSTSLKSWA